MCERWPGIYEIIISRCFCRARYGCVKIKSRIDLLLCCTLSVQGKFIDFDWISLFVRKSYVVGSMSKQSLFRGFEAKTMDSIEVENFIIIRGFFN